LFGLDWMGVGLPEEAAKSRFVASIATMLIGLATVAAAAWLMFIWPLWASLLAAAILCSLGFVAIFWIVGRVLSREAKRQR
jgi:NhaP-type Na+/H+ or K+/H+ antiporter